LAVAQPHSPAFGAADLSNCEREQIHLAGSIQPHGALLVVRAPDLEIVQVSDNAAAYLGVRGSLHGARLRTLGGNLDERIGEWLAGGSGTIPAARRCTIGDSISSWIALAHRTSFGELVIEIERTGPSSNISEPLEQAVRRVVGMSSLKALCEETGHVFRDLTGYDRVMVYRFDDEGHGEVFAETKKPELEAFLGNRYPASDIPQIARRLYERNRVRVLADIRYTPAALTPRLSPISGKDLDMSLCFLRSVSPIHLQYLKNMGVEATLVVSLMVGGRLWGLISCHHYSPRLLPFEMRSVCEILGEVVGTRIAALESFYKGQGELAARRLEQRMIESVSREGDWRGALFDRSRPLLLPLGANGAALLFEDEVTTIGDVPATDRIREIARWIGPKLIDEPYATSSLGAEQPSFTSISDFASGVVAMRISTQPGEMLLWFRPEQIRTVTWGGNPFKTPSVGDDPSELSPRRSFAQWHQIVEGTSIPWTAADLAAARFIGASIADVIVQFRAVRILIAQDQLEKVLNQIRGSDQQIVVAGAEGEIIECNSAFMKLLGAGRSPPRHIDQLADNFAEDGQVRVKLKALVTQNQPWRGEALVKTVRGPAKSVLVRADPVFATANRVLGFVLLFADLTQRKAAERARRLFQDGILRSGRKFPGKSGLPNDVAVQNLMSAVIENAQLAALEITDAASPADVPALLDTLRMSVDRAAEVLRQLTPTGEMGPAFKGTARLQ
jgi:PAS domain S-box-containing protein